MAQNQLIRSVHFLDRYIYRVWGRYKNYRSFSFESFAIAFLSIVLAALVRVFLSPFFGEEATFNIFIASVLISAWLGGFHSGLLAVALAVVAETFIFLKEPDGTFVSEPSLLIPLIIFMAVGFLMTTLITALIQTRRRMEFLTKNLKAGQEHLDIVNRHIRSILESINDGFAAFDRQWRFVYVNPRIEELFGVRWKELLGKNIWEKFPGFVNSVLREKCFLAVEKGEPLRFEYYSLELKKWFLLHAYPGKDGLSLFFDDITDIKDRERRKDEFVSVASHELKTPVTSTKLFAQMLRDRFVEEGDEEAAKSLEKMDEQLDKLAKLILTLLDVSKMYGGKLNFKKKKFSLSLLASEAVSDMKYTEKGREIKIFSREDDIEVFADRDRILQVINNLLTNALKYSAFDKDVSVSVSSEGDFARVAVKDQGIGVPKEKMEIIFEKFFQINDSEKREHSGLGLGLYISKEIIEQHGGKMWLESEEGKGSTFYFTVPFSQ
ncbi:MAG: ATP-binding protein [bacterium]|nr:ATP-binding protein [bacterium]